MVIETLGNRIRLVREKAKLSQEELAEKLGVTQTTITRYENGHRLPCADFLESLVKLSGCDPGWLLAGEAEIIEVPSGGDIPGSDYILVPRVSGEIAAGEGLAPEPSVEIRIAFRRDWIQKKGDPKNMSLIRVRGDSMEPTLFSGDTVLIDHGKNYIEPEGGLYAMAVDGLIMIKRLQPLPDKKIRVISDNPKYVTYAAAPERIHINGKAVWFGREID